MSGEVIRLPVRRKAPPAVAPVAYEATIVADSVKVVIGDVELWFTPEDAVRFGSALVTVGTTAKELNRRG